jgi:2-keto-4-pentenoate hydratase
MGYGAAAPLALDTLTAYGSIIGPPGKVGRVVAFEWVVTVTTTTNPTVFVVDTAAGLTLPFTSAIPAVVAPAGGAASAAELSLGDELPADTPITIVSDAGAAAGDGYVVLEVVWY